MLDFVCPKAALPRSLFVPTRSGLLATCGASLPPERIAMRRVGSAGSLLLLLCAASSAELEAPSKQITTFVQRSGTRFVVPEPSADGDVCTTFSFVGANAFSLMVRAADPASRCEVATVLDSAASLGVTVLRTWAFSDGADEWRALQREPGAYDANTLVALDWVISQASQRGIRVLLAFGNAWGEYGGIDQYNRWAFAVGQGTCDGAFECRDTFWRNPYARRLYKAHIKTVLLRRNTFTGILYRDDPGIFGFDLMNEPRSSADLYVVQRRAATGPLYNITYNSGDALHDWVVEMGSFVKALDPVHLLTVGQEGFFGPSSPLYLYANPGPWAALLGNDFVRQHRIPSIDFAAAHVYVDQWLCTERGSTLDGQLGFFKDWLTAHLQAAEEELRMPFVLEEFGAKLEKREAVYRAAFDIFEASARRGGGNGLIFWDLVHPAARARAAAPAQSVFDSSARSTRLLIDTVAATPTLFRQPRPRRWQCRRSSASMLQRSQASTAPAAAPAPACGPHPARLASGAAAWCRSCSWAPCPGRACLASHSW